MKKFDIRLYMASVRREAGENLTEPASLKSLAQLLRRRDEDFVRHAYWQILGREVDPQGLADYSPQSTTLYGRLLITAALLLSPEKLLLPSWLRSLLKTTGKIAKRKK